MRIAGGLLLGRAATAAALLFFRFPALLQLYNLVRNRWCGAYFASKGIRVVPTVSWGNEATFDFCFEGISRGSTVAVSTNMVGAHGHHSDQKKFFMRGCRELIERIEPERIICYNEPFSEMEGNIAYVDYELSSWKYQNDDHAPSKFFLTSAARNLCRKTAAS